jgi:SEC-C motif domain protein
MRARYTAYAQNRTEYLRASWHPDTCPTDLKPDEVTQWRRLEIRGTGCEADEGWVHFCATWQAADQWGELEERSRFVRQQGRWLYHSGDVVQRGLKPGRNDPCPCGSGRKLKKCCAA